MGLFLTRLDSAFSKLYILRTRINCMCIYAQEVKNMNETTKSDIRHEIRRCYTLTERDLTDRLEDIFGENFDSNEEMAHELSVFIREVRNEDRNTNIVASEVKNIFIDAYYTSDERKRKNPRTLEEFVNRFLETEADNGHLVERLEGFIKYINISNEEADSDEEYEKKQIQQMGKE